jgi:hypothetical protein
MMALIASGSKSYTPPPEGMWHAVCVDVVDLGMVNGQWGEKHKCRIVWELNQKMSDGRPFTAQKQYTISLHEKASLYKDLKAWRGKPFTTEELEGFDVEKVIGAPCQLVITHEEKDGMVYGNITAIIKADPKNKLQPVGTYVRAKDRKEKSQIKTEEEQEADEIESGEAIPF